MPLTADFLFTCRIVRKHPWLSLAVITAMLLGVGASTAVYAIINAVLFRPVPVFEPDKVVRIYARVNATGSTMGISYPEYLDWKAQSHSFEAMAVMRAFSFYSTDADHPTHLKGTSISASGFTVFGVSVIRGRSFTEDDDRPGASKVVILSHRYWEQHFGSDPKAIGQVLLLDGEAFTVIGVLQPTALGVLEYPDVWVPNGAFLNARLMDRKVRPFFAAGRLKASIKPEQARSEIETIASRLAAQFPATNAGTGIKFIGLTELLTASDRYPVVLLFVAGLMIFGLTCANVVVVMLSWAARRRMELAIRLSLGASRIQVLRQLFLHSLVLVAAGGALGLICAKWILAYFLFRFPNALIRFREISLDYRVIGFLVLIVFVAALAATLIPSVHASRVDIGQQLKLGQSRPIDVRYGRGRYVFLIALQISVATSFALLSGLLIKSLYKVANVDLGFTPHHIYSFQLNLPARFKTAEQVAFYSRVAGSLSSTPGLFHSSAISSLPLTTQASAITLQTEGGDQGSNPLLVEDEAVLPGLFSTLKVPLIQGRDFTDTDRDDATPVAIVDEVLALKLWPKGSAIGKRIRLVETTNTEVPWREIVGVVRQIKHFGPESKVRWMQVYVPEYQDPSPVMSFVIDTTLPPAAVKSESERVVRQIDHGIPVDTFQTMDSLLDDYLAGRKVTVLALTAFAAISIVLAVFGIYGVISNETIGRRREIAIRMAVGATMGSILLLLVRRGVIATLAGVGFAVTLVASCARVLAAFLFGVAPIDSGVYVLTAISIVLLTTAAAVVPARSLFQLSPTEVLRSE
jgi:putative ABC transport system permease protein